ncbi:hypothetical protein JOB18_034374 [Solea senegalensis]|uniref:Secreted protein n=1 Tax=Solea senegalensis TaxID=28829 RepID=A0AAV6PI63_SOLSE|nr:hypothetical protein JOB18_034374 [Solea senegalensis]
MEFFMFSPCLCGFPPGCLASSHSPSIIYRFVLHQRDAVPSPAVAGGRGGGPPCTLHQLSGFLPQSIDHLPLCPPLEGGAGFCDNFSCHRVIGGVHPGRFARQFKTCNTVMR